MITTASGIVTAVLGTSAKSPASSLIPQSAGRRVVLYTAAGIFIAALAISLTTVIDLALFGTPFRQALDRMHIGDPAAPVALTAVTAALALAGTAVGYVVNVNRFSLHAMYRNRLIRTFLGASNAGDKKRNNFTWFNETDNVEMHRLWDRAEPPPAGSDWRPFHVINAALNVVATKRLAWQERKAESFVFTPLWCGAADLDAFRRASEFAGLYKAITLGTAMAVSGAAVSPNMGYNSSPLVTLLLTLFNVRLGWWFGNPKRNEYFKLEGPRFAAGPLLVEALGLTTDERPYVYLSDGGHFENLGLYEMVRRRCHEIVLCDAGHDPDCAFADLANATRKIAIDFGIPISFPTLRQLRRRNDDWTKPDDGGPGFAIGLIDYKAVDGDDAKPGIILYIKPSLRGDEPSDVLGYAAANRNFPHDETANQWFQESQFESYRVLGRTTMERVYAKASAAGGSHGSGTIDRLTTLLNALRWGAAGCG